MDDWKLKLNRVVFALAALCFLLPFVNFSCAEMPVGSVTGFDMIFGSTKLNGPGAQLADVSEYAETGDEMPSAAPMMTPENQAIEPNVLVMVSLACCILGLFLSFSDRDKTRIARVVLSVGAMITLIIFRLGIESRLDGETAGMVQAETAIGLWLVLTILALAVWLNWSIEQSPDEPYIRARFDRTQVNNDQKRGSKVSQP